ncbi:hypothetical protein ACFC1R_35650 [Kitasatospora sp. NPDC056138]|uniref:hypothetical protein n=1 Tax=Kitasatospora sp. NPDC056138 TaxID=3345724 RepID=UPI0035D79A36
MALLLTAACGDDKGKSGDAATTAGAATSSYAADAARTSVAVKLPRFDGQPSALGH